jgi:hypothetical protein
MKYAIIHPKNPLLPFIYYMLIICLKGFVVGFCGAKVFCLQFNSVITVEVSQSSPMYQYIEKKMFL